MSNITEAHHMLAKGKRKLTVADGMIQIAALAAWFALVRMTWWPRNVPRAVGIMVYLLGVVAILCLLTPWMLQATTWL